MSYELPHSNAGRLDKAIERITVACGEVQTSGLPFAAIQDVVMGLMQNLGKLNELRGQVTVKDKIIRERKVGEISASVGAEVLSPDELARLEAEAGVFTPDTPIESTPSAKNESEETAGGHPC